MAAKDRPEGIQDDPPVRGMGGREPVHTERLSPEDRARLEELREKCAVLDRRGHSGTLWHDELAMLESRAARISQEDTQDGTT